VDSLLRCVGNRTVLDLRPGARPPTLFGRMARSRT